MPDACPLDNSPPKAILGHPCDRAHTYYAQHTVHTALRALLTCPPTGVGCGGYSRSPRTPPFRVCGEPCLFDNKLGSKFAERPPCANHVPASMAAKGQRHQSIATTRPTNITRNKPSGIQSATRRLSFKVNLMCSRRSGVLITRRITDA